MQDRQDKKVNKTSTNNYQLEDELVELEFDEDSVAYYIVDENDNEIGVCLYENGKEVEYMYEDADGISDEDKRAELIKNEAEKVSKEVTQVKEKLDSIKGDAVDVASELKKTSDELHEIFDDIKGNFDILNIKKK